jgi:hypothetical protein
MEVFALILLILSAIFYFIPTGIAKQLEQKLWLDLFINLVFGWTVLWLDRCAALGDHGGTGRIPRGAAIAR